MKRAILLGLMLTPAVAAADEVHLKGGGRLTGVVLERRADTVFIDVGAGTIGVPADRIERIDSGASALSLYRERAARLGSTDLNGWLALGLWAQDHGLLTQAREAFTRVLTLDPANAAANRALGHVQVNGTWLTLEDSYRARGLLHFEGAWITPDERHAILAERAAAAQAEAMRQEAEARVREAEARAQAAEAEARRLEDERQAAAGIPYGVAFGGYGPFIGGFPVVGGFPFGVHPPVMGPHRGHKVPARPSVGCSPHQSPRPSHRSASRALPRGSRR